MLLHPPFLLLRILLRSWIPDDIEHRQAGVQNSNKRVGDRGVNSKLGVVIVNDLQCRSDESNDVVAILLVDVAREFGATVEDGPESVVFHEYGALIRPRLLAVSFQEGLESLRIDTASGGPLGVDDVSDEFILKLLGKGSEYFLCEYDLWILLVVRSKEAVVLCPGVQHQPC